MDHLGYALDRLMGEVDRAKTDAIERDSAAEMSALATRLNQAQRMLERKLGNAQGTLNAAAFGR